MKNLTEYDSVMIGILLGMIVCFLLWLIFTLTPIFIGWILEKYWERGGGEKIRKRNKWRKKLNLPKLKY